MSFLRPAARAILVRWAEAGIAATVLALALPEAARLLAGGGVFSGFALAVVVLAAVWLRAAVVRALLRRRGLGPGAVALREGELSYFGPETGGVMALDEVRSVEIVLGRGEGGAIWRLHAIGGRILDIPVDAAGADAVPEGLATLPGFQESVALDALSGRRGGAVAVWHRPGGAARLSRGAPPPSSGQAG